MQDDVVDKVQDAVVVVKSQSGANITLGEEGNRDYHHIDVWGVGHVPPTKKRVYPLGDADPANPDGIYNNDDH